MIEPQPTYCGVEWFALIIGTALSIMKTMEGVTLSEIGGLSSEACSPPMAQPAVA